jgi:hypothetical protein
VYFVNDGHIKAGEIGFSVLLLPFLCIHPFSQDPKDYLFSVSSISSPNKKAFGFNSDKHLSHLSLFQLQKW